MPKEKKRFASFRKKQFDEDAHMREDYTGKLRRLPYLYLAYTYHLNRECTKYTSFGYSETPMEPVILIHEVGESFVILNCLEYSNIVLHADHINSYFNGTIDEENVPDNRYVDIRFENTEGGVLFVFNVSATGNMLARSC